MLCKNKRSRFFAMNLLVWLNSYNWSQFSATKSWKQTVLRELDKWFFPQRKAKIKIKLVLHFQKIVENKNRTERLSPWFTQKKMAKRNKELVISVRTWTTSVKNNPFESVGWVWWSLPRLYFSKWICLHEKQRVKYQHSRHLKLCLQLKMVVSFKALDQDPKMMTRPKMLT